VRRQSALTPKDLATLARVSASGTRVGGDVGRVTCCRPWELFPFLTSRTDLLGLVAAEHRQHAVVEQAHLDLKDQALAHFPSRHYFANAAWTVTATLAHNLARWPQTLALPNTIIRTARTRRRRLFSIPRSLVGTASRWTLRMPARWP
jgi:hypothetical protein